MSRPNVHHRPLLERLSRYVSDSLELLGRGEIDPAALLQGGLALETEGDLDSRGRRVAVIDIGSNSTRLVVFDVTHGVGLHVVSESKSMLRLTRELDADGRLGEIGVTKLSDTLDDLIAIARGDQPDTVEVVATETLRAAVNGPDILRSLESRYGLDVRILSGAEEAAFAFAGSVYGLPVTDGLAVDVGGGSVEIAGFSGRRLGNSWTLPFGALRASDAFLHTDPPRTTERKDLLKAVTAGLWELNVPKLGGGALVGAGGTIRNLAKIERRRQDRNAERLHGFSLSRESLDKICDRLTSNKIEELAGLKGLNPQRVDSIVGGALVVQSIMEHCEAKEIIVSGRGVREGVALADATGPLPPIENVRRLAARSLGERFRSWSANRAYRRSAIVESAGLALEGAAEPFFLDLASFSARLIDIGSAIDYYNRFHHSAEIVESADLDGFSHRELALMALIIRQAETPSVSYARYRPAVEPDDLEQVARAACLVALSEELERRLARGGVSEAKFTRRNKALRVEADAPSAWLGADLRTRFHETFGVDLELEAD